jgi:hypothetical protein
MKENETLLTKTAITHAFSNAHARAGVALFVFRIDVSFQRDEQSANIDITV